MIDKIKSAKKMAIFTHINPDGDALSSAFALMLALNKLGKKAFVFLDGNLDIKETIFSKYEYLTEFSIEKNFDLAISVDTSQSSLLGKFAEFFLSVNNLVIDHNPCRRQYGKIEHIKNLTSCTMVVFDVIKDLGISITSEIATLLFYGLITDSNRFLNTNTTDLTFKCAQELISLKADMDKVYTEVYRSDDLNEKIKFGELYKRINIDGDFASLVVTTKDNIAMPQFFANEMINLKGINVSVIVYEIREKEYSLSLRSKNEVDVAVIAKVFGGGGHVNASGADNIQISPKEIIAKVKRMLESK